MRVSRHMKSKCESPGIRSLRKSKYGILNEKWYSSFFEFFEFFETETEMKHCAISL